MAARLGDVLYWLGCITAVGLLIVAAVLINAASSKAGTSVGELVTIGIVFGLPGILAWLGGRACRYILAGR